MNTKSSTWYDYNNWDNNARVYIGSNGKFFRKSIESTWDQNIPEKNFTIGKVYYVWMRSSRIWHIRDDLGCLLSLHEDNNLDYSLMKSFITIDEYRNNKLESIGI